ncbi:hypothetical protein [Ramlibacter rhizophilus]|uniref:Uncharacterized protein n=1 Tax=Ramlibacter rhizophilus TaxID=1781167 RepID=A0A4Z0BKT7_9BURK|nr:hypothetical protein [Ramlibacter rhizophilus]TFY99936.1 hypothetical protein EZ242_12445 [Ramlibacter rhizophilus]
MTLLHSIIALAIGALPLAALADRDKHEHGWRGHHGAYKQEWWDGHCKVERKYKSNGDYKEERKCRNPQPPAVVYVPAPVVVPAPVYMAPPVIMPAPVFVEPGLVIQGTVRVR